MKKFTFLFFALCMLAFHMNAQFVDLDNTKDPQKGDILSGDIDNDGDMDIIFNGVNILPGNIHETRNGVLLNDGNGNFTLQTEANAIVTGHLTQMKFGDIDGDGDMDVIYNGTPADGGVVQPVGIALNNGNGVFTLADKETYPLIEDSYISCGFADFDNNGLLDYYIFGNELDHNAIFFQQIDGTFITDKSSFTEKAFIDPHITVVDFNNDGFMDLFVEAWIKPPLPAGATEGRYCRTYKNDGFGKFTVFEQPNIIQKSYGSAAWGDIDGDGWMDLVMNGDGWVNTNENSDGVVRIYKNQSGTLVPKTTFEWYRQISIGDGTFLVDWDNDGDLDVITGGWEDNLKRQKTALYLCTDPATFTFEESQLGNTSFPGLSEQNYDATDLNGDGKVDLIMMGYNGDQPTNIGKFARNIIGWCPNNDAAVPAYSKPTAPTSLSSTIDGTGDERMVTLSWVAPTSEASKKGTTYNLALKNTDTGKWHYNPMAVMGGTTDGWHKTNGTGNVGLNQSWELYGLPDGNYEWTVQAINGAYFGGSFAATEEFTLSGSSIHQINGFKPKVYVANGSVKVESATPSSLKIYSITGVKVYQDKLNTNYSVQLQKGTFLIEVENSEGFTYKTKVII